MITSKRTKLLVMLVFIVMGAVTMFDSPQARAQQSSFGGVVEEPFAVVLKRDKEAKARVMAEHQKLLEARYDLSLNYGQPPDPPLEGAEAEWAAELSRGKRMQSHS